MMEAVVGLKENDTHRLICLNAWFPDDGLFRRDEEV